MERVERKTLSFWVTVAFTLNYSLGSGFLTLPWAFSQTGTLLGVAVLILFGIFSILATFFLLETIDRGQKVLELTQGSEILSLQALNKKNYVSISDRNSSPLHDHDNEMPSSASGERNSSRGSTESHVTTLEITFSDQEDYSGPASCSEHRKLEINELCQMFLGPCGKVSFTLLIMLYMGGTLWAYGTVFSNAFAAHLSVGPFSYYLYLLLFAAVVVPASLLEFSEQVAVQVTLSLFRVLMVVLMALTTLCASLDRSNDFQLDTDQLSYEKTEEKVELSNLFYLLPVAAYAYIFHHSLPSLEAPYPHKAKLCQLFATAILISMLLYIVVGAVVSAYFRNLTDPSSNLNWVSYRGPPKAAGLGSLISFFVVIFPAIDVASAYPLNAYTLGNNLSAAFFGQGESVRGQRFCRLLSASLPLLGALIDRNLGHITDYTGLAAFALAFIFPPILSHCSKRRLEELGLHYRSAHSSFLTSPPFQGLLLGSGLISLLFAAVALLRSDLS